MNAVYIQSLQSDKVFITAEPTQDANAIQIKKKRWGFTRQQSQIDARERQFGELCFQSIHFCMRYILKELYTPPITDKLKLKYRMAKLREATNKNLFTTTKLPLQNLRQFMTYFIDPSIN